MEVERDYSMPDHEVLRRRLHAVRVDSASVARTIPDDAVVLWEATDGVRCVLLPRHTGGQVEIAVVQGGSCVWRMAFDTDTDAADFAIAAMHDVDGFVPRASWPDRT
jgi:hypothetical protein